MAALNLRAMILSLVTGLGHVYLRHYVLGACLFVLFTIGLNGVFLGSVIESNPTLAAALFRAGVPFSVGIWFIGLIHAWRISYGTDRNKLRVERQRFFREGLVAYLRDDLDGASKALRGVVERDVDWEETDALFHLGVVELRRADRLEARGEPRPAARLRKRALRAFRACLARDDRKKWRGEIAHERERANLPPTLGVPRRPVGMDSSDERPLMAAPSTPRKERT
jgi:hypothetical protein